MDRMIRFYSSFGETVSGERKRYLLRMINNVAVQLYRYYLLYSPDRRFEEIREYEGYMSENCSLIQFNLFMVRLHRYLPFPILWYWRKYSKRIPSGIVRVLFGFNSVRHFLLFGNVSVHAATDGNKST
jgi:hypothetical protein